MSAGEHSYNLKPKQDAFIFSKKRYPAFIGGWATGKSMALIFRAMFYSENIPNNLGIIFRKEFTDLRDSTLKDFENYTQLRVSSQRSVALPNKSEILFRHIEELNNIQNVNLGWFAIEQGDELASDREFYLLFGRLRRDLTPTQEFTDLGLPLRSGWVIGNAGDHWMKPLWKDSVLDDAELFEMTTLENQDVLPKDFIDSLKTLEKNKAEVYKRYVLNDWSVTADQFILINPSAIEALKNVAHFTPYSKKIIACDPSQGGDATVVYVMDNCKIVEKKVFHLNDTMKLVGELMLISSAHKINDFAIDTIGIGKGVGDRLNEMGKKVQPINSAESAIDKEQFYNLRTEMWWNLLDLIQRREIPYPNDEELRKELSSVRYRVINSNGKIQLEPKDLTKKRIGHSPDSADAFVYGAWGTKQIDQSFDVFTEGLNKRHVFAGAAGWGWIVAFTFLTANLI